MGDEYEDSGMAEETGSPLAILAGLGNPYTSKEAHDIATRTYRGMETERTGLLEDEDEVTDEMRQASDDAKAQLRAAREALLNRRYDQSEKWLSIAAALGKPTNTGSFFESVGNVAEGQMKVNANRREFQDKQQEGALEYGQSISKIDQLLAMQRAALNKSRREANTKLSSEALKILAREVRPGAGGRAPPSKYGKIAMDLGFTPGTEQFAAKVAELEAIDRKNNAATAGTDAEATPEQVQQQVEDMSYQLGAPIATLDPYRGMSTKQKTAAMSIEQRSTEKRLEDLRAAQGDAIAGIGSMNRFLQLNRKTASGPIRGRLPGLSASEQEMDSITAEAARKMKQPGEGSVSNFDASQFLTATVSRSKQFAANRGIATAYKIMRKNEIDRISFIEDYAQVNGHLRGADAKWREYLESNPIFDTSKPGKFILNNHRMDYRAFFRNQMGGQVVDEDPPVDDSDPTATAADNVPAQEFAEGGRVGSLAKIMYHVIDRKTGEVMTRKPISLQGAIRRVDGLDNQHGSYRYGYRRVTADENYTRQHGEFAEGGQVTDNDIYGVPDETPDEDLEEIDVVKLREALYAALQGGSLGTADEIRGIADPEGAAQDRAEYSEYAAERPFERAGAFTAGLLPLAALAAPGAGGLLQSVALGGGTGAIVGASGNTDERGVGAIEGGAIGAVAAPVATLGTRYIYNKAGHLYDKLTGKALTPGEEKLVLAANRDNLDLGQVATDLRASDRLRVPEGVQDVGGRRTQALIERAATRGGPESDKFLEGQNAKQDASYSRVEDQVNRGLVPSEYFGEFDRLQHELYNNAKPLYDKAYKANPGIKSKAVMEIMDTPDGKKAVREAFRLMANDRKPIGKANAAGLVQKPSLEFLDYVKRGFDQMITTEEKGGATTLGRSMRNLRNQLRDELDQAAPEYAQARGQYAGDLEVRDALTSGRENFANLAPEEVRRSLANMSYAEKDAFRSGVSQHLFQILGKPSTDFNAARRLLGSDAMREKLQATFDDPKKWKIFEAAMDKEAAMYDRTKKTVGRVEGKKLQALGKEDSVLSNILDGGMANTPGMGGISWVNRIYNWLRFPMPMSEKTADQIMKTIDRGDIKAFEATMKRLAASQSRLKVRGKRAGKVGAILAILAGGLTQPTPPGEAGDLEARP